MLLHLRRVLYRPRARRTAVVVVALATAAAVTAMLRAADDARGRWGETRPVVVARRDLAPGELVDESAVEVRQLPGALVGRSALDAVPVGAVARYPVLAGEPLTPQRLSPHGVDGVAALVPQGHRAISIPAGQLGLPPVQVDDLVDVIVVQPAGAGDGHGHDLDPGAEGDQGAGEPTGPEESEESDEVEIEPAYPLVVDARVVEVTDEAVTVAVPVMDAPRLAYAVANGVLVVALTGN